jgi:hypothetical protein
MSPRATNQEPEMLLPVIESGNDGLHICVVWSQGSVVFIGETPKSKFHALNRVLFFFHIEKEKHC